MRRAKLSEHYARLRQAGEMEIERAFELKISAIALCTPAHLRGTAIAGLKLERDHQITALRDWIAAEYRAQLQFETVRGRRQGAPAKGGIPGSSRHMPPGISRTPGDHRHPRTMSSSI